MGAEDLEPSVSGVILPHVDGWILGDTHMHTSFSDSLLTLNQVRSHELGLKHDFTCITDHIDRVEKKGWDTYYSAIVSAGDEVSGAHIMVPGIEVTCVDDKGHPTGDAVGIGLESMPRIRNRQAGAPAVVDALKGAGSNVTVAIAHPSGKIPWKIPHTPGITGVEVISSDGVAEEFWRSQIANCSDIARPSALGGSDEHVGVAYPAQSATWVYCPGFHAEVSAAMRRLLLLKALIQGATVATGIGSLAYFTLNGVYPGDIAKVDSGSELYADIYLHPVRSAYAVSASWTLYAGPAEARHQPETAIMEPGHPFSWPSLKVPVLPGVVPYHLSVAFRYYLDDVYQNTENVFCGPVYTHAG